MGLKWNNFSLGNKSSKLFFSFLISIVVLSAGTIVVFKLLKPSNNESIVSRSANQENSAYNPSSNFKPAGDSVPINIDPSAKSTFCNIDTQNWNYTCGQETGLPQDTSLQTKTVEDLQSDLEDKTLIVYQPTNTDMSPPDTTGIKPLANPSCGKTCVYSQMDTDGQTRCYSGNCQDGTLNCDTNTNCGYVSGCSAGSLLPSCTLTEQTQNQTPIPTPDETDITAIPATTTAESDNTPTPTPLTLPPYIQITPNINWQITLNNLSGTYPYVVVMNKPSADSDNQNCSIDPGTYKMSCKAKADTLNNIPLRTDKTGFKYIDPKDYAAYFQARCNSVVKDCMFFATSEDVVLALKQKTVTPKLAVTALSILAVPGMIFGGEAALPVIATGIGEGLPYAFVYATNMIPAAAGPVLEFAGAAITVAMAEACRNNDQTACANIFAYGTDYMATGISGFENLPKYAQSFVRSATVQNLLREETGSLNLGYIYTMLTGRTFETDSYIGRMLIESPFFNSRSAPWYSKAVNAFLDGDYNAVYEMVLRSPNTPIKTYNLPNLYQQWEEKGIAVYLTKDNLLSGNTLAVESLILNVKIQNPKAITAKEALELIYSRMMADGILRGVRDYVSITRSGLTTPYLGLRSGLPHNKFWAGSMQNEFLVDMHGQMVALQNAARIKYGEGKAAEIFGDLDFVAQQKQVYQYLHLDSRVENRLAVQPLSQQEIGIEQKIPANFNSRKTYTEQPPKQEQPQQPPPRSNSPPPPSQPRQTIIGKGAVQGEALASHGGVKQDWINILYDDKGNAYFAISDGVTDAGQNAANAAYDTSRALTTSLKDAVATYGDDYESIFRTMETAVRRLDNAFEVSYGGATTTTLAGTITSGGKLILYRIGDTEARIAMSTKIAGVDVLYYKQGDKLISVTRGEILRPDTLDAQFGSQVQVVKKDQPNQIGMGAVKEGRMIVYTLKPGYRVIVSSDGIAKVLSEDEIFQIVRSAKTPAEAESALVNAAIERGKQAFITYRPDYEKRLANGEINQQRFDEMSRGLFDDYSAVVIFNP